LQLLARLDHPGVVQIYDHGIISDEAARAGGLQGGAPWFAMEWAGGGTLAVIQGWPGVRSAIADILAALAHAHSRGVVHLDVKPENILRSRANDLRPGWKLADFGISQLAGVGDVQVRGTPAFMAPEQIRGEGHLQGPWTDLYALACAVWLQVCGEAPYGMKRPREVVLAHMNGIRRRYKPRVPVPADLGAWLRWCLARDPMGRPRLAADALQGWLALGPPVRASDQEADTTMSPNTAMGGTFSFTSTGRVPAAWIPDRVFRVARMPDKWDEGEAPVPSQLWATGLGVYGLRDIGVVGRRRERNALWSELRKVERGGGPRCVLIQGAAGTGKSRLGRWLLERVDETGAATGWLANHTRRGSPRDGVAPALGRLLRVPVDNSALAIKLLGCHSWVADLAEAKSLRGWLRPGSTSVSMPGGPLARVLGRASGERPLVWVIDDAQWAPEALALASVLLADTSLRLLVVLLVRDEALAERPDTAKTLQRMAGVASFRTLDIGRLPPGSHRELVSRLLGLDGALIRAVDRRTRGNPLFAVQLVGDWVQRGLLQASPQGWTLRQGAVLDLPDDLHDIWKKRAARLLGHRDEADHIALQLAAALGHRVDREEWYEACAALGQRPREGLLDAVVRARLGDATHTGFAFVHGMLRESIERSAREAGRAPELHLACAEMLASRTTPAAKERRARHLDAAGDQRAGLGAWIDASLAFERKGDLDQAEAMLQTWRKAIDKLGLAASDTAWVVGLERTAALRMMQSRDDEAVEAGAAALGHPKVSRLQRVNVLSAMGFVRGRQGEFALAAEHYQEARRLAVRLRDNTRAAMLDVSNAELLVATGQLSEAERLIKRGLKRLPVDAPAVYRIDARRAAAWHSRSAGDLQTARKYLLGGLAVAEEAGARLGIGLCARELGALCWADGDVEGMRKYMARALRALKPVGQPRLAMVELYQAVLCVDNGDFAKGHLRAEAVRSTLDEWGRDVVLAQAVSLAAQLGLGPADAKTVDAYVRADRDAPVQNSEHAALRAWVLRLAESLGSPHVPLLQKPTPASAKPGKAPR
jgi:tetratricopeptide (TPR) repeat protein